MKKTRANIMEAVTGKIILRMGYAVFEFFRNIYMFLDLVMESAFGYSLVNGSKKDQEMFKHRNDGYSCHLVKIIGRGTARPTEQVFLKHFMLRHEAYIDLVNYVLNNDHIIFMGMSETEVWFSISPFN